LRRSNKVSALFQKVILFIELLFPAHIQSHEINLRLVDQSEPNKHI
jgi:hypothetical protein